jgi:hypothetical protein
VHTSDINTYLPTIDRYDYGGAAFAGMVLFPMPSWGCFSWVFEAEVGLGEANSAMAGVDRSTER